MTSVLGRRHPTDQGKSVKYTPCAKGEQTDEEELEEIAVVSQENICSVSRVDGTVDDDEGSRQGPSVAANGPRVLPGTPYSDTTSDRTKLIGERLSCSGRISLSSPVYSSKVAEHRKSSSNKSLFEMVSHKIDSVKQRTRSRNFSISQEMGYINKAHVGDPVTPKGIRKQRRKELDEKFGKKACRGDRFETSTTSSEKDGCRWTFVFDPAGRFAYWWSFVISIAFIYNFWVLIYRFAFEEIDENNMAVWFTLDYLADFLYVLDIAFHFRTGFLEDGVLQTDGTRLRIHYMNSTMFYIDCLCLLPLDFLYLSIGFKSMLRCFRLVKIYRFWAFLDRTERHTNYPNVVRTVTLLHYLFAIYHWNACLMFLVTRHLDNERWLYPSDKWGVSTIYLHSLYWSTLTLTTIGDLPRPKMRGEYIFVIMQFVFGLLLFATILGHVANIVTGISAARRDFQAKLDCVKTYMTLRRVPLRLQDRVIKWYDYLWLSKKSSDEDKTLNLLPDKLKAEIALHVHLDTLKRVEIFQNTEAGFLCELVLRLRPVLFSPKDYICRKGEVGKEMYVVNRGKLQVVADNGKTVLATLRAGSYFGEISILNMGNAGNRRTASVRSVGYSDLFVLSKTDLWEVLKDYPTARVRLEAIAVKRLEKYKKAPLEQGKEDILRAALPRSKSTPGLLESGGKVPLEVMPLTIDSAIPEGAHTPRPTSSVASHCTTHSNPEDFDVGSYVERVSGSRRSGSGGSGSRTGSGSGSAHAHDGDDSALRQAASADITNSMTVSSITSYITESSTAQKSPPAAETLRNLAPSPSSPRVIVAGERRDSLNIRMSPIAGSAFVPIEPNVPRTRQCQSPGMGVQPTTKTYGEFYTSGLSNLLPAPPPRMPQVSPSAASRRTPFLPTPGQLLHPHPQFVGVGYLSHGAHTLPTNASTPSLYTAGPATTQLASGSTGSIPPIADPSQEILLQEITRLRERLHTLESENASMNLKLNQQQFDVENRLTEIEMHFCGDSSTGSGDSEERLKNVQGHNESVI